MHYRPEDFVDYFDKALSADRESALEEHLGRCPDCARRARSVRRALFWWDAWSTAAMSRAAQTPAPASLPELDALLAHAETGLPAAAGERSWGLSGLRRRVRQALREGQAADARAIQQLVRDFTVTEDGFFLQAAGEEDRPLLCTVPAWCTSLLGPPERLAWFAPSDGPWRITIRSVERGVLLAETVARPELVLDAAFAAGLPRGEYLRWQISEAADEPSPPPLVRGVFEIRERTSAEGSAVTPAELAAPPSDFTAVYSLAARCHANGLFDDALRTASAGLRLAADPAQRILAHRLAAAVYRSMAEILMARFRLGDPEGLWAAEMARRSVAAAARLLGSGDGI